MVETSFNIFDVIVLTIIGLSALFSFYRGFVRELLSLGAWVGALVITLYAFPHAKEYLGEHINNTLVVDLSASIGVYLASLITLMILTSILMKFLKPGKEVGALDNLLGLGFGTLRGLFIVALGFLAVTKVFEADAYPPYIKEAFTRPYVEKVTAAFVKLAPDYLGEKTDKIVETAKDAAKPSPENEGGDTQTSGYQWESMDKLQQMIDQQKANTAE